MPDDNIISSIYLGSNGYGTIFIKEDKEYRIFSGRIIMNILMIHPHDLYSPLEPWTVRIKNIAYQFTKKGHSVKLVYFSLDKKDANKKFLDKEIEVISLDRRLGVFILLRNIMQIIRIAEWSDIIHFQKCYYYASLPALIAAWIKKKAVHYDWDDWETKIFYYSNPKLFVVGEFINIFEKLIPKIVDTISVSSGHLRKLCLKRGVPPERICLAPVGADLEKFRPDLNFSAKIKTKYNIKNYLILYIGQLHGGQYAELFIKAAQIIIGHRKDLTFMIVGEGYRLKELKELTERENVDKYFVFTGFIPHDEIPSYIADADVCVACFEENDITRCKSPLKIVEYLACGKAIVASNVGEIRNMVGGVGILAKPGDVKSLSDGIMTLLHDKELRERLMKQSRQRVETTYNWSVTAKNLLNAYQTAINA
jgi:glycosyltransferase involved in cell wall biosynthesis